MKVAALLCLTAAAAGAGDVTPTVTTANHSAVIGLLTGKSNRCRPRVTPDPLPVTKAGMVHWHVVNTCGAEAQVEILDSEDALEPCSPVTVAAGATVKISCKVNAAQEQEYKYGIKVTSGGKTVIVDPELDVRGGT